MTTGSTTSLDRSDTTSNHSRQDENYAYDAIEVKKDDQLADNLASEVVIHNPPLSDKWGRFDVFALLVDKKIGRNCNKIIPSTVLADPFLYRYRTFFNTSIGSFCTKPERELDNKY